MTVSEPSFIPLFFDESEADLWQVLQQIEPVKRSVFIKATLRQVLLTSTDTTKNNSEHELTKDNVNPLGKEIEPFSLEALFTGVSEPDLEDEGLFEHKKTEHNPLSEPWDYLLNTVIGEENDVGVINAILQAVHPSEKQDNISGNKEV